MRRGLVVLFATALLASLAVPAAGITNGQPDDGEHPYVSLVVFDVEGNPSHRCSASLLTPTVVLTAGHCTEGTSAARIWFDEDVQDQIVGQAPPVWTGLRIRLKAGSQFVSGNFVHADEFVRLSQNPGNGKGGTCFGDSGGPDLLGGTDTVLAVNSYVTNGNCAGVGYGSRVDIPEVLDWINSFLP